MYMYIALASAGVCVKIQRKKKFVYTPQNKITVF